jgi:hypothetical protein
VSQSESSAPKERYPVVRRKSENVAVERTEVSAVSATRKASQLADQQYVAVGGAAERRSTNISAAAPDAVVLHSPASAPRLGACTGDANSTATRRKSMSRRIIVAAGNTKPEIRQRGYVYQKGRKQSEPGFLPNGLTASFGRMYPARPSKSKFAVRLGSAGTE